MQEYRNLPYIKGMTFAPFSKRGTFQKRETFQSLDILKEITHTDLVLFAPAGLQDTPHSETITWNCEGNVTDEELTTVIQYAQKIGFRTALKPTVNCKDGTWRAYISFFDEDVPCEPKWSDWFASYTDFQLHYAKIAQETGCEMFIAGCEMVMSEHREAEWRNVIASIRNVYQGLVSYNTDKYQEHNVKWWDCVDVISSSGYYPINDWERQLDRVESVVKKYNKPFFFAEAGCMSTEKSNLTPNDWKVQGNVDLKGQADWYAAMFKAIKKRPWVRGCVLWSWDSCLYTQSAASRHRFYEIYQKPAQEVISKAYKLIH